MGRELDVRVVAAAALAAALTTCPLAARDLSGLPEPVVGDRPDFTESTETIPPGHVQLESGYTLARGGGEDGHGLGELLLRLGAGEIWELRLGFGSYAWTDGPGPGASGVEDANLGAKLRLLEPETGGAAPAVSLIVGTGVPTGGREVGAEEWQPEAKLLFAWGLTDRAGLSSNLNYTRASGDDGRFDQLSGSLSLGWALTERAGAYLEYFAFDREREDGPAAHYVDAGLTWSIWKDLQLDVRAGAGLNGGAETDSFAGLGAVVRW